MDGGFLTMDIKLGGVMKNILAGLVVSLLMVSCGGSDDGDTVPSTANVAGYPDVTGLYSFNTDPITYTCSDGAIGTNPAAALNFNIYQNANVLTLVNTNLNMAVGGSMVVTTDLTGNIEKDGSFVVNQAATTTIEGVSGIVSVAYNLTGVFSDSGWRGVSTMNLFSNSYGSCLFTTSFTGSKIISSKSDVLLKSMLTAQELPLDVYDSFGIIGSSVGITETPFN